MNRPKKIPKTRSGGSLIEVLIALALFAAFIAGAVKVIMMQQQVSDKARAHYTAINIAKNRIEYLRNMRRASFDQIAGMTETDKTVNDDGLTDSNGKFSRTTEIETTSVPGLLEIEVTVKIKDPRTLEFDTEQENLKSYMAKLLES